MESSGFQYFTPVVELLQYCVSESMNTELLQAALVTFGWKNIACKIFVSLKLELHHELVDSQEQILPETYERIFPWNEVIFGIVDCEDA